MAVLFRVEGAESSRPLLAGLGILALLLGGLLLFFPLESLRLLLSLAGLLAIALGVILLAGAAKMVADGTPAFLIALVPGLCALVFGVVAFTNPGLIAAFFAVILGFGCLIAGLAAAGAGLVREAPLPQRLLSVAGGCLLAAIGLLVLLDPRDGAALALQLLGLLLVAGGVILLAFAFRPGPPRNPLENPEYRVIEET